MARVDIDLNGRNYSITCEEGQEQRLREVAAFVDAKMGALAQGKMGVSESQLLVLTALTMADQLFDLRAELAKARTGSAVGGGFDLGLEERYAAAVEALAKRVNAVASKLARA